MILSYDLRFSTEITQGLNSEISQLVYRGEIPYFDGWLEYHPHKYRANNQEGSHGYSSLTLDSHTIA